VRGLLRQKPSSDDLDERPRRDDPSEVAKRERIHDSGILARGVKVDTAKLTDEEADELIRLHRKARIDPAGYTRSDLELLTDRERRRFGELLDRALPDHLREARRNIEARRRDRAVENLALTAVTQGVPPRVPVDRPPGWALVPVDAFEMLGPNLTFADVGMLAAILSAFAGGPLPFADARWSEDSRSLIVPKRLQLRDANANLHAGSDIAAKVLDVRETLTHLARNDWVTFELVEGAWSIGLGPRAKP